MAKVTKKTQATKKKVKGQWVNGFPVVGGSKRGPKTPVRSDKVAAELLEETKRRAQQVAEEAAQFERDTDPKSKPDEVIEPIYSTPTSSLRFDALPLMHGGSRFFVIAADSDKVKTSALGNGMNDAFVKFGLSTGSFPSAAPSVMPINRMICDLAPHLRKIIDFKVVHGRPDLVFVVLGDQDDVSVASMRESLVLMRKQLPKQRILWVLSASTPPSIAKALHEANEEWIRSPFNGADVAETVWRAATAKHALGMFPGHPPTDPPKTWEKTKASVAAASPPADADAPHAWTVLNEPETVSEFMSREEIAAEAETVFDGMKAASLNRLAKGTGWLTLQSQPMFSDSHVSAHLHALDRSLLYLKETLRTRVDAVAVQDEQELAELQRDIALVVHNLVSLNVAIRHARRRAVAADLAKTTITGAWAISRAGK